VRLLDVQQHGRVVVCIALVAACISCEHCLNECTHNIEPQHTHQADQSRSRAVVRQAQQHLRALNRPRARRSRPWTGPAATQARTEPPPVMRGGTAARKRCSKATAPARQAPKARTCPMWPTASTSQCPVLCRTPSCQPHVARSHGRCSADRPAARPHVRPRHHRQLQTSQAIPGCQTAQPHLSYLTCNIQQGMRVAHPGTKRESPGWARLHGT